MEEGQSQTEVLLREIAENMAILRACIQETQPAEDDPWGRNKSEIRREGLRFGQSDPPSAGTATDGTTSRRDSAGQGSTTEWMMTKPNGVCSA